MKAPKRALGEIFALLALVGTGWPGQALTAQVPLLGFVQSPTGSSGMGNAVDGRGDYDGDGANDVLVGVPGTQSQRGEVFVYSGVTGQQLLRLTGPGGRDFGKAVAWVGDTDGDGLDDFVVGVPGPGLPGRHEIRLYAGGTGTLLGTLPGRPSGNSYGRSLDALGDVDGDGFGDFVVGDKTYRANPGGGCCEGMLEVVSGGALAAGAGNYIIRSWVGPSASSTGQSVAGIGDLNGDGVPDYAVGSPDEPNNAGGKGVVRVFSGSNGFGLVAFEGRNANDLYGWSVAGGDVDADGVPDIVISAPSQAVAGGSPPSRVEVWSGASLLPAPPFLSPIYTFTDPSGPGGVTELGRFVAVPGDLDGDGHGDVVATRPQIGTNGGFRVWSGATGQVLYDNTDNPGTNDGGNPVHGIGDVNGDGFDDFVVGAPKFQGSVMVFSGRDPMLANAGVGGLGGGCGTGGAPAPGLASTPPLIGETFTFSVSGAAGNAPGWLAASPPPASPVSFLGCTIHLDPAAAATIAAFRTNASGDWTGSPIAVPFHYSFAGIALATQAVLLPPAGFEVTNGLRLTVGY